MRPRFQADENLNAKIIEGVWQPLGPPDAGLRPARRQEWRRGTLRACATSAINDPPENGQSPAADPRSARPGGLGGRRSAGHSPGPRPTNTPFEYASVFLK